MGCICSVREMVYPLRFAFASPVFGQLSFLFLVRFLQRLIGLCQFRWFIPGNLLYEMVYSSENTVIQNPSSVPYCQLVLLIRFVLYQYGYVADVPFNRMMRSQSPLIVGRDNYI